jgi:CubicO group peptidase (beta-lactamase class C family)
VDQRVLDFFPEYAAKAGERWSTVTVKHLLTMTAGFAWDEDPPYGTSANSETRMANSGDATAFVFARPIEHMPGTFWNYSGGTTHLLGAIIERTSGMTLSAFAAEYLFRPLGIREFEWVDYPRSTINAPSYGLRLRPRDMLKFGMLYVNDGKRERARVLSAQWVHASLTPAIMRDSTGGYGYQFWTWRDLVSGTPFQMAFAIGNGGQVILLDVSHRLVVVATAGQYNDSTARSGVDMAGDFIYPAMLQSARKP